MKLSLLALIYCDNSRPKFNLFQTIKAKYEVVMASFRPLMAAQSRCNMQIQKQDIQCSIYYPLYKRMEQNLVDIQRFQIYQLKHGRSKFLEVLDFLIDLLQSFNKYSGNQRYSANLTASYKLWNRYLEEYDEYINCYKEIDCLVAVLNLYTKPHMFLLSSNLIEIAQLSKDKMKLFPSYISKEYGILDNFLKQKRIINGVGSNIPAFMDKIACQLLDYDEHIYKKFFIMFKYFGEKIYAVWESVKKHLSYLKCSMKGIYEITELLEIK